MECWSIGVMYDIAEDPILQYSIDEILRKMPINYDSGKP